MSRQEVNTSYTTMAQMTQITFIVKLPYSIYVPIMTRNNKDEDLDILQGGARVGAINKGDPGMRSPLTDVWGAKPSHSEVDNICWNLPSIWYSNYYFFSLFLLFFFSFSFPSFFFRWGWQMLFLFPMTQRHFLPTCLFCAHFDGFCALLRYWLMNALCRI